MQINHYKACTPKPLFNRALTLQGHYLLALTTTGPNTRQLGTAPMCQNLMKIFNPRPALLVPSQRIHNRGSCRHLPHSLCLLTESGTSLSGTLHGMSCLLFLWICDYNKLLSSRQLFSYSSVLSYLFKTNLDTLKTQLYGKMFPFKLLANET